MNPARREVPEGVRRTERGASRACGARTPCAKALLEETTTSHGGSAKRSMARGYNGSSQRKCDCPSPSRCSPEVVTAGDVLLFHEGQPWTLDAIPRIVAALHASGLECVTMHDLFAR